MALGYFRNGAERKSGTNFSGTKFVPGYRYNFCTRVPRYPSTATGTAYPWAYFKSGRWGGAHLRSKLKPPDFLDGPGGLKIRLHGIMCPNMRLYSFLEG